MESKSWLSKVCHKLRSGGKHRPEKCEKCGQRSDTCLPNPSFISGRKHFLCEKCRVSSRNMKTMYQQLCRSLSLRDTSRTTTATTTTCASGDLFASTSPSSSSSSPSPSSSVGRRAGTTLTRSKSLKVRPTTPESGYDTATSLDCSSSSISSDPALSMSCGECGGGDRGHCCGPHSGLSFMSCSSPSEATATATHHHHYHHHHHINHDDNQHHNHDGGNHSEEESQRDSGSGKHVCPRTDQMFGGAFKSERVHLQRLQQFMVEEWVHAAQRHGQSPDEASPAALPRPQPDDTCPAGPSTPARPTTTTTATTTKPAHPTTTATAATKQYDGYLEIRTPNSGSVKYVFKKPESHGVAKMDGGVSVGGQCSAELGGRKQQQCENLNSKQCYRCHKRRSVAFRAPFGHGWLCEDCMDDLM